MDGLRSSDETCGRLDASRGERGGKKGGRVSVDSISPAENFRRGITTSTTSSSLDVPRPPTKLLRSKRRFLSLSLSFKEEEEGDLVSAQRVSSQRFLASCQLPVPEPRLDLSPSYFASSETTVSPRNEHDSIWFDVVEGIVAARVMTIFRSKIYFVFLG